jgi:UDP-N-acetylmuramate--alanine ligase
MKIHLIGIGGIGVSALAQYYLSKGYKVSGSDLARSEITDLAKSKGAKIFIGNFAKNISKDIDLVVHSPAVKKDNAEYKKAKQLKIKTLSYPEALGELTKEFYTIAVSGAHGKSTTTSMLGLVLIEAGLDPTVIVGTKLKEFGNSNFRGGKSKLLVIEACEYDSSFLEYQPKIVVITNVDKEHLDYFKIFENVKKAFADFITRLPAGGFLVANADDQNIPTVEQPKFKTQNYSLVQPEAKEIKNVLKVPGQHNVANALAVLQVARILEIPDQTTFKALSEFRGTWRRFQIKQANISGREVTMISDYGHHPNEVAATLKAAREKYKTKKIWCVFQPHQYQRTYYLFEDFIKTFKQVPVDKVILTDIYDVAGREVKKIKKGVSSKKLVDKIAKESVIYLSLDQIEKHIKENIKTGEILVIMGAGDIYKLADKF